MADVGPRRWRGASDRAQLMLVTALTLAILFVTLALIVNTAIYTENLATRSSDIGGGTEAVRYQEATHSGVGGLIEYANYHANTSYDALQTEIVAGVDAFDNRTGRQFAPSDRAVETTLTGTVNGTRVEQTDDARNFSDVDGTVDWTVVEDVDQTRSFRINVTSTALLVEFGFANVFTVVVDRGGTTWRMNVTESTLGGEVVVGVRNGAGDSFVCPAVPPPVVVDVTAGTVGGTPCDGLSFGEGVGPAYNISYQSGDNIEGTYSMVVDNDTLATSPGPHLGSPTSQPFATYAIYSANLTVTYQTPRLYYDTTVRVAPGEPDG